MYSVTRRRPGRVNSSNMAGLSMMLKSHWTISALPGA